MKRQAKKGFTLVELLATITILIVLIVATVPSVANLIKKSKEEHDENIVNTVIMAAKSYIQDNKKDAPKYIGDKKPILLTTLREKKYLKEDIYDSAKNTCMRQSYVEVFKKDAQEYVYSVHLNCAGKVITSDIYDEPSINIFLTDNEGKEFISTEASNDISISKIRVTMFGGKNSNGNSDKKVCNDKVKGGYGLVGYSIFIYKYTDIEADEYVEVYNSGSLRGNDKKCLTAEVDLAKYIDVTKENKLKIVVRANNDKGVEKTEKFDAKFDDKVPPKCGEVYWQAGVDEWSNNHERTVAVRCDDEGGSGCRKDLYITTFNKEMENGAITIKDNKGNERKCNVRVNLDWTSPTVKVKAYKRTTTTAVVNKTVRASDSPYNLKEYDDGYGTDNWLNKSKFPNGISYNFEIDDNFTLKSGDWKINAKNLVKGDSKIKRNLTSSATMSITGKTGQISFDITEEGYRYGVFSVSDKAGNKTIINVTAPIDRTAPTCNVSGGSTSWINTSRTIKATCGDTLSGCMESLMSHKYDSDINTDKAGAKGNNRGGKFYDNAGNSVSCSANQTVKIDKTNPTCTPNVTAGDGKAKIRITCTDNTGGSGIKSCASEREVSWGGSANSKTYTFNVKDNAENPNTCQVTVHKKKQYYRASCALHKECKENKTWNSCKTGSSCAYYEWTGRVCYCHDLRGYGKNIGCVTTNNCNYYCRGLGDGNGKLYSEGSSQGNCGSSYCVNTCSGGWDIYYTRDDSCDCESWGTYSWQDSDCPANSSTTCNKTSEKWYYYK